MKKKIYFIQPNSILGNSVYFPYAVGVIAAYSFQFEDINKSYELGGIVYKEDPIDTVLPLLDNPFIVGFSNYFWNYQYNLNLAKQVKQKYPQCMIIFGGHQIPEDITWLEKHKFIDALIYSEGELPFLHILRCLKLGESLNNVANISYRSGSKIIKTKTVCEGIEDYPSPYLNNTFDKLLNVSDKLEFNAQLETNRGCPYHCSFCDWCAYDIKMRVFPLERVKADLKWISEHKIAYCMCVDSNFGLFERDEEIAAYAVSLKKHNGYPDKFGACFAKNKTDRIFKINKMFNDVGMSKGVSLAFQSMSDEVLVNVSRSNMNKDKLQDQLALYHDAGIPTYTELILGLPGETTESFKRGICELLELGQHDSINVFRCEVYPNSTLANKDYIKKFGIKTAINKLNINHCKISEAIYSGGLEYITETSTMTPDELVEANVFSACIQSVHCHGMLQCVAIYLHNIIGVSYYDFYSSFIKYFMNHQGVIGNTLRKISECIRSIADGVADLSYINPLFGDITWPYEEAMLIDFIYESDRFYKEAEEYVSTYNIESEVFNELMKYQKNLIVTLGDNDTNLDFKYDFCSYFKNILANKPAELKKVSCSIHFSAQNIPGKWEDFSRQIIWYGRRNKKTIKNVTIN